MDDFIFFISMRDKCRYQGVDRSGTYGSKHLRDGELNVDESFSHHFAVRRAQLDGDNNLEDVHHWREQFDSISKDFLSNE